SSCSVTTKELAWAGMFAPTNSAHAAASAAPRFDFMTCSPNQTCDCGTDGSTAFQTACALRQPSRPNPPRPVANNGRAAGKGVVVVGTREMMVVFIGMIRPLHVWLGPR